jgi:hypothetical protein
MKESSKWSTGGEPYRREKQFDTLNQSGYAAPRMKKHFSTPEVSMASNCTKISLTVLMVCILGSGCNLKTKQEKDQEKSDQQAAQQAQAPAEALTAAQKELRARISLYNSFAGEYDGSYLDNDKKPVMTKILVSVSNAPDDSEIQLMTHDTDATQREDAITLQVQTQETLTDDSTYSFFCLGENVKPDFSQGVVNFGCDGETAVAAPRQYSLYFAMADVKAEPTNENSGAEKAQNAIRKKIGEELVSGQMTSLPAFQLKVVMNPNFGGEFFGTLVKQN